PSQGINNRGSSSSVRRVLPEEEKMNIDSWAVVLATLASPIFAVQVQKTIESITQGRAQRLGIFKSLMATRGASLSPEHVRALNMIDLEFVGRKFEPIRGAWKLYLDHLNSAPKAPPGDPAWTNWNARIPDLLHKLLAEMATAL